MWNLNVKENEESTLASAKRSKFERSETHNWHTYYAGYSEAFVESAIKYLRCDRTTLLFDPWGGSGTTGMVAARRGVPAVSIDINPVMATFAAAKSMAVLSFSDEITRFFRKLTVRRKATTRSDDPLLEMFDEDATILIRSVISQIPFGSADNSYAVLSRAQKAFQGGAAPIDPAYAFAMAVIFKTARSLSAVKKGKNPTWIDLKDGQVSITLDCLLTALRENCEAMLSELRRYYEAAGKAQHFTSLTADVRDLPLKDNSISRIITSPPYLTRIDYAVSTKLELALFEDPNLLHVIRHRTIGAPVITKREKKQNPMWGSLCNGVLDAIKAHSTKAAASYYWKNIVQYFMDVDSALIELYRVLKPGGTGLIVVQSSYFKEIEIVLGDIYVQMAAARGFTSRIVYREEVKGHMAHVNTKSNMYMANKVYFEDFVYIEKPI